MLLDGVRHACKPPTWEREGPVKRGQSWRSLKQAETSASHAKHVQATLMCASGVLAKQRCLRPPSSPLLYTSAGPTTNSCLIMFTQCNSLIKTLTGSGQRVAAGGHKHGVDHQPHQTARLQLVRNRLHHLGRTRN